MTLKLRDHQIQRIQIVDNDPYMHESYNEVLSDLHVESVPLMSLTELENNGNALSHFVKTVQQNTDAAICGHPLQKRHHAPFSSAQAVASFYQNQFPAILCTRYEKADSDEIRAYRSFIPVVLAPHELDPHSLSNSFQKCINEFNGEYLPSRRAWRALIYIDNFDEHYVYMDIPSWNPHEVIRWKKEIIPVDIQNLIEKNQEYFYAYVNIGAEKSEELYIKDWETH